MNKLCLESKRKVIICLFMEVVSKYKFFGRKVGLLIKNKFVCSYLFLLDDNKDF